jgi:hypothetical protein
VWWDPDLRAGDPWARRIEEAVEAALSVIVLWSREAVESRWVSAEARVGLDRDKLVPVCLDDAEPPLVFREIQWRSLAGWDGEGEPPGIEDLVADVEAAMQRSGGRRGREPGAPSRGRRPWRALADAAAGLALGGGTVVLDLWGAFLEGATDVVIRYGLLLPPLALQVAAVGLAVLYLARHRRRVWPLRAASPLRVLVCSVALALGLGVLYDWLQQSLGSKQDLNGRIQALDRQGIRVTAWDSLDREISSGGGPVDGEDGGFNLQVEPFLGDRPKRLTIRKEGCVPVTLPIERREWRSRRELEAAFDCQAVP